MFYFIDCFSLSARRVPDDNKSRPLCCFLEHFGANTPTEAVGRYLPRRPHHASHKQSAVLPTVPRVFPSPSQRHASLRSVHWHGTACSSWGCHLNLHVFHHLSLIHHSGWRRARGPRSYIRQRGQDGRASTCFIASVLHSTHTHTPPFFFSFLPLSLFLILP